MTSSCPTLPAAHVVLDSREIPYRVRHSRRARGISLTIRPDTGLVATLPAIATQAQLEQFLRRHARWILRHVRRQEALAAELPRRWPYGPALPYLGQDRRIAVEAGPRSAVALDGEQLRVVMRRPGLEGARRALRRWFLAEGQRLLPQRVEALAPSLGLTWRRVRVRDQRSRWGSCSVRGDLHFNFRLVMTPPAVSDYVVVHELMHRRELNHSRRFWALVAAACPAYREHVAWLRRYGPYLGL